MAYRVTEPIINLVDIKPLGIPLSSFKEVYLTTDQAFENLKTLLLTRKGERYRQPTFGTDLLNILFQPNTNLIKQAVSDIITTPVSEWLPYITIEQIDVRTNEDDPSLNYNIEIIISFSVDQYSTQTITVAASEEGVIKVSSDGN
jgi:phage baseplate assembly protein W